MNNGYVIGISLVPILLALYFECFYIISIWISFGILTFSTVYILFQKKKWTDSIDDYLSKKLKSTEEKNVVEDKYLRTSPWSGIQISETLNNKLEQLIELLLNDFVDSWYKEHISTDNTFLLEIKYQIRYGASTALRALRNYDFVALLEKDLLHVAALHAGYILDCKRKGISPFSPLDSASHHVLNNQKSCQAYLRNLSELLVERLFDESRIGGTEMDAEAPMAQRKQWPSETCRHFMRELILYMVIIPVMDFISDPYQLNNLILMGIKALDSKDDNDDLLSDNKVPFLVSLGEFTNVDAPDSLLSLNLKELQRDQKLLHNFYMYLNDAHGPTHWLDFFIQIQKLLHQLHDVTSLLDVLSLAAISIHDKFLDKKIRTFVELTNDEDEQEFMKAIETKDLKRLVNVAEKIYKEVYQELNYSFVVPFCQSENYLRNLCGTSQETIEFSGSLSQISPGSQSSFDMRGSLKSTDDWEFVEDEAKSVEALDSSFLDVDEMFVDQSIDINGFTVTINIIEPRKHCKTGRLYYVYKMKINREIGTNGTEGFDNDVTPDMVMELNDDDSIKFDLPSTWSIIRTYDEFYVLDRKLADHYSASLGQLALLPDRKMFCPRSRAFLESQRQHVERYIQQLTKHSSLKRSQLLYAFLTNIGAAVFDEPLFNSEFDSFNAVRKSNDLLETDKKQFLKPFIARLLTINLGSDKIKAALEESDSHVITHHARTSTATTTSDLDLFSDVDVNIVHESVYLEKDGNKLLEPFRNNLFYLMATILLREHHPIFSYLLSSFTKIMPKFLQHLIRWTISFCMQRLLTEKIAFKITQALFELLTEKDKVGVTEEEKEQTTMEAKRLLLKLVREKLGAEYLATVNGITLDLFECIQLKNNNKQLLLLILDVLVQKLLSN